MFVYERPVRFEEVDAADIVFYSRFLTYCHEALEALFASLPGGYPRLVLERRIGIPAVHVEIDYKSPLRFGDVARIEVTVEKLGRSSCTFRHEFSRKGDGTQVASIKHVCAVSDLSVLRAIPIPDDVRALLSQHLR